MKADIISIEKVAGELSGIPFTDNHTRISILTESCLKTTGAVLAEYQSVIKNQDGQGVRYRKSESQSTRELNIDPISGILGTSGSVRPLVIPDLQTSFDNREISSIISSGIKTYFGYPVLTAGEINGYLHLFYSEETLDFEKILRILGTYAFLISQEEIINSLRTENENLIKKSDEKEQFLGLVIHDLKSPFNGFLGLTYLLTDELDNLSREEIYEITSTLRKSADNMFSLLENQLEWSRIQRNIKKFEPQYVLLHEVVNQAIQHFSYRINQKQIEIYTEIPENVLLYCDLLMTSVIIRNILSNSIKFSKKGAEITIKVSMTNNNQAEIIIEDHGTGIPEDILSRLFRINELVKRPGTDGESGSGLGLIISRYYIEKHGGELRLDTRLGEGTSVKFTMPLLDENSFL